MNSYLEDEAVTKNVSEQANKIVELEKRIERIEGTISKDTTLKHMAILAYSKMRGLKLGPNEIQAIGKKVSKHCRKNKCEIKKIPDQRYGSIGSYPIEVLDQWFCENNYVSAEEVDDN